MLAENACDSPRQDVRNEFEVLTALIYCYEQRTSDPQAWSLAGADVVALLEETLFQRQLSVAQAAYQLS